jgi:ribosomal protein S18 acetylase RimI-like enzyme
VIRKLACDGLVLKEVRLRALGQAPGAFAQSAAGGENDPDEGWVAWATELAADDGDSVVFLAFGAGAPPIGMAGAYLWPDEADVVVWGVWVDPAWRGAGWGRRLMEHVIEWAENPHGSRLAFWVTSTSEPALGLYRGLGFEEVEESRPDPRFPRIVETAMGLDLLRPTWHNGVKPPPPPSRGRVWSRWAASVTGVNAVCSWGDLQRYDGRPLEPGRFRSRRRR